MPIRTHHRLNKAIAAMFALLLPAAFGCEKPKLTGVKAEVVDTSIKLDMPEVPKFEIPQPNADGTHSVAEMRLRGNRYLGTEVKVKGHVIWVYDCATAIRTPEMSIEQVNKIVAENPDRCDRPNIYLGDTPDTPADKGVWLVEVPRPPRPDEIKAFSKEDVKVIEDAWQALPPFEIRHQVTATGMWELTSPRGFKNSGGLLVYKGLENKTVPYDPLVGKKGKKK